MPQILHSVNPVTRLLLMVIISTPILLTVDRISAGVSLLITVALAPLCGVSWPRLGRIAWPLFIIAPLSGISMLLYGREGGQVYFSFWLATVSDNSIDLASAIMLRVLAVALPVIILARDIDPTELGDGLAQILKFPARFVIGAVAGVRMATLFRADWKSMARARRARGVADMGRLKSLMTMSFGLLVLALRRGGKLATAMEARGFGRESTQRTFARPASLGRQDWLVLAGGVVVAAIPVLCAVAAGSWRFFGL